MPTVLEITGDSDYVCYKSLSFCPVESPAKRMLGESKGRRAF